MKDELVTKLRTQYPKLFEPPAGRNRGCGIECGDGWFVIIDSVCEVLYADYENHKRVLTFHKAQLNSLNTSAHHTAEIKEHIATSEQLIAEAEAKIPQFLQIKEKFGTLTVYVSQRTPEIQKVLSLAASVSARVCETCGRTDDVQRYNTNWIKVLCPRCANERYGVDTAFSARQKHS